MKLTLLGTGTSCGVPVIGCQCEVCRSEDPRDKRTRCSALVETETTRLLIDCGPDFRQQILPQPFRKIDGILVTHSHYDHVGGMDDIRPYCQFGEMNIGLHEIHPHQLLRIGDLDIMPIEVMHGKLPILGYRIGPLTYITDMKTIHESEYPYLEGTELLVVNALRFIKPHHSHQLVDDAIAFARRVGAKRTLLIHMCHDVGLHEKVNLEMLPADIQLAYDGQEIIL